MLVYSSIERWDYMKVHEKVAGWAQLWFAKLA